MPAFSKVDQVYVEETPYTVNKSGLTDEAYNYGLVNRTEAQRLQELPQYWESVWQ